MDAVKLKPGQLVEVELEKTKDEIIQFRTLVEECKGDSEFILLAPMYKAVPYPFQKTDSIDVIYTIYDEENKPTVFAFKATTAERIKKGSLTFLRVVKTGAVRKLQRRGFFRLSYVAEMQYEHVPENEDDAPYGRSFMTTKDVSAGGFRGIFAEELNVGDRIIVHLDLGGHKLSVYATVVRRDRMEGSAKKFDVRTEFAGISSRDTSQLIAAINHVQAEYIRRMAGTSLEDRLAEYGHEGMLYTERRKGKDRIMKWLDTAVISAWLFSLVALANFLMAMPEAPNIIDHYYGYQKRRFWDPQLVNINLVIVMGLLGMSLVSLLLNSTRMKRESDRYRLSLVFSAALALILLAVYLFYVFPQLEQ